jgi:Uncharacterised nucleotidyltransferase
MNPLLAVLRHPARLPELRPTEWDLLVRTARRRGLLGHLGTLIRRQGAEKSYPTAALEQIAGFQVYIDHIHTQVRWELAELSRALRPLDTPLVLLKGAAYLALDLPWASTRTLSDLDLLVPRQELPDIERRLLAHGWVSQTHDPYDQHYYREWMHEIPPLRHSHRGVEVDIHHTLTPLSSRYRPDPALLWAGIVPLPTPGLAVLDPLDQVLHSATHLLTDGEMVQGLRDLVDLHELLAHYGGVYGSEFWLNLGPRARRLGLDRPLAHALHCLHRLLGTSIPDPVFRDIMGPFASSVPAWMTRHLVAHVLRPRHPEHAATPVASWLLYVRSHWLRMPPALLARHLARKSWNRLRGDHNP